tara:strand:- start:880 stop:1626 length:747 start_codon:yes stop_codon:yes gene_type:complete
MKIIIIDDEERARKSIAGILKLSSFDHEVVAEGDCVKTGIETIKKHKPDLILLDINMPDGTGFDLLKALDHIDFKIIFITAYEEFAVKAFEFSAIDYILKPADPKKLLDAISKAQQLVEQENINLKLNALFANLDNVNPDSKKLVLKTAEKIYLISTQDIIRCEADMGYTQFFLADGKKILISKNLKDYEILLDGLGFFRIHQSHLINIKYIDYYDKTEGGSVRMKDTSMLPLSRRKKESFLKLMEMM